MGFGFGLGLGLQLGLELLRGQVLECSSDQNESGKMRKNASTHPESSFTPSPSHPSAIHSSTLFPLPSISPPPPLKWPEIDTAGV